MYSENILRKEVIQPHLPIRLPCYDFTPIIYPTFAAAREDLADATAQRERLERPASVDVTALRAADAAVASAAAEGGIDDWGEVVTR